MLTGDLCTARRAEWRFFFFALYAFFAVKQFLERGRPARSVRINAPIPTFPRKRGKGLQTKPPPAFGGHPLWKGGFTFLRGFAPPRETDPSRFAMLTGDLCTARRAE